MGTIPSFSNNFYIETALQLGTGTLGAGMSQDVSWLSSGLALGALNHTVLKSSQALVNTQNNPWIQEAIKAGSLALASFLVLQGVPSLPPNLVYTVAGLNLLVNLSFNYFSSEPQGTVAPPTGGHVSKVIKLSHEGELTLPKTGLFQDLKALFDGLFHFIFMQPGSDPASKEQEDIYYLAHFSHDQLVRANGTFLESPALPVHQLNFVLMECIEYTSQEEAQQNVQNAVEAFLNQHNALPQKLIIPFGGCTHTACLVIEPNSSGYTITALDSLGPHSTYGYKEAMIGAQQALQTRFPGAEIKTAVNSWDQNNAMRCGVHVMHNVTTVSEYSGSLYTLITNANLRRQIPTQFARKNPEELTAIFQKLKKDVSGYYRKVIQNNPGKIFAETDAGRSLIMSR